MPGAAMPLKGKQATKGSAKPSLKGAVKESPEAAWTRKQLNALASQREAAVKRGDEWLEERHRWHEAQLEELLMKIVASSLAALPEELREGVDFYVSQCADGEAVTQETFYDDRELYAPVLGADAAAAQGSEPPYVRPEETEDAKKAIEVVAAWDDISQHGLANLERRLAMHADSAGLHEAALKRISCFVMESKGQARDRRPPALSARSLLPVIRRAMGRCPRDGLLQRQGCKAVLALSLAKGGLAEVLDEGGAGIVVDVLRAHRADADVVECTTRIIESMTGRSRANSPERCAISSACPEELLKEVCDLHRNRPYIEKATMTTIPFLRE